MHRKFWRIAALAAMAALSLPHSASAEYYADVDFLLLTAKTPSEGFRNTWYRGVIDSVEAGGTFSDSMQYATRLTVGAEDCCGFGGRVRWFTFDNDIGYTGEWDTGSVVTSLAGDANLDVDAIDFDVTQRGSFGHWSILGSAGLRYGRVDLSNNNINFGAIGAFIGGLSGLNFEGVGPTLALEGRRPISDSGLSLFAVGRSSLLWGDVDIYSPFLSPNLFQVRDETVQVWEFQMGMEYATTIQGATVETGIFWETQRWDSENNSLGDLSLMGLGIHTGVSY